MLVVGDSVMLGAAGRLPGALRARGWQVTFSAQESRFPQAGVGIVRSQAGSYRAVVFQVCTNYGGGRSQYAAYLGRMLDATGGRRVVLVTCPPWHPGVVNANAAMRAAAAARGDVVLADWAAVGRGGRSTYADGIHLRPSGASALAALVAAALGRA